MKLVIQIPCHNEAATLPAVLADLPSRVDGVSVVRVLVINDGSTDGTAGVARAAGVEVLTLPRRSGLARAFLAGLDRAVAMGADIIVNTDGDGQYRGDEVAQLVAPILEGRAELVIGVRPVAEIASFSPLKKLLQRMGSAITRFASATEVEDAPSGFRAFSRSAAMRMHVFNRYTYTVETIIQAGQKGMAIATVPVSVNPQTRPSRLAKSMLGYVARQVNVLVRVFMTYRPFRFFAVPGAVSFLVGGALLIRFLYFYFTTGGQGHVQSVVIGAMLTGLGVFLIVVGLLADLISVNRQLLEDLDWRVRRMSDSPRASEHSAATTKDP